MLSKLNSMCIIRSGRVSFAHMLCVISLWIAVTVYLTDHTLMVEATNSNTHGLPLFLAKPAQTSSYLFHSSSLVVDAESTSYDLASNVTAHDSFPTDADADEMRMKGVMHVTTLCTEDLKQATENMVIHNQHMPIHEEGNSASSSSQSSIPFWAQAAFFYGASLWKHVMATGGGHVVRVSFSHLRVRCLSAALLSPQVQTQCAQLKQVAQEMSEYDVFLFQSNSGQFSDLYFHMQEKKQLREMKLSLLEGLAFNVKATPSFKPMPNQPSGQNVTETTTVEQAEADLIQYQNALHEAQFAEDPLTAMDELISQVPQQQVTYSIERTPLHFANDAEQLAPYDFKVHRHARLHTTIDASDKAQVELPTEPQVAQRLQVQTTKEMHMDKASASFIVLHAQAGVQSVQTFSRVIISAPQSFVQLDGQDAALPTMVIFASTSIARISHEDHAFTANSTHAYPMATIEAYGCHASLVQYLQSHERQLEVNLTKLAAENRALIEKLKQERQTHETMYAELVSSVDAPTRQVLLELDRKGPNYWVEPVYKDAEAQHQASHADSQSAPEVHAWTEPPYAGEATTARTIQPRFAQTSSSAVTTQGEPEPFTIDLREKIQNGWRLWRMSKPIIEMITTLDNTLLGVSTAITKYGAAKSLLERADRLSDKDQTSCVESLQEALDATLSESGKTGRGGFLVGLQRPGQPASEDNTVIDAAYDYVGTVQEQLSAAESTWPDLKQGVPPPKFATVEDGKAYQESKEKIAAVYEKLKESLPKLTQVNNALKAVYTSMTQFQAVVTKASKDKKCVATSLATFTTLSTNVDNLNTTLTDFQKLIKEVRPLCEAPGFLTGLSDFIKSVGAQLMKSAFTGQPIEVGLNIASSAERRFSVYTMNTIRANLNLLHETQRAIKLESDHKFGINGKLFGDERQLLEIQYNPSLEFRFDDDNLKKMKSDPEGSIISESCRYLTGRILNGPRVPLTRKPSIILKVLIPESIQWVFTTFFVGGKFQYRSLRNKFATKIKNARTVFGFPYALPLYKSSVLNKVASSATKKLIANRAVVVEKLSKPSVHSVAKALKPPTVTKTNAKFTQMRRHSADSILQPQVPSSAASFSLFVEMSAHSQLQTGVGATSMIDQLYNLASSSFHHDDLSSESIDLVVDMAEREARSVDQMEQQFDALNQEQSGLSGSFDRARFAQVDTSAMTSAAAETAAYLSVDAFTRLRIESNIRQKILTSTGDENDAEHYDLTEFYATWARHKGILYGQENAPVDVARPANKALRHSIPQVFDYLIGLVDGLRVECRQTQEKITKGNTYTGTDLAKVTNGCESLRKLSVEYLQRVQRKFIIGVLGAIDNMNAEWTTDPDINALKNFQASFDELIRFADSDLAHRTVWKGTVLFKRFLSADNAAAPTAVAQPLTRLIDALTKTAELLIELINVNAEAKLEELTRNSLRYRGRYIHQVFSVSKFVKAAADAVQQLIGDWTGFQSRLPNLPSRSSISKLPAQTNTATNTPPRDPAALAEEEANTEEMPPYVEAPSQICNTAAATSDDVGILMCEGHLSLASFENYYKHLAAVYKSVFVDSQLALTALSKKVGKSMSAFGSHLFENSKAFKKMKKSEETEKEKAKKAADKAEADAKADKEYTELEDKLRAEGKPVPPRRPDSSEEEDEDEDEPFEIETADDPRLQLLTTFQNAKSTDKAADDDDKSTIDVLGNLVNDRNRLAATTTGPGEEIIVPLWNAKALEDAADMDRDALLLKVRATLRGASIAHRRFYLAAGVSPLALNRRVRKVERHFSTSFTVAAVFIAAGDVATDVVKVIDAISKASEAINKGKDKYLKTDEEYSKFGKDAKSNIVTVIERFSNSLGRFIDILDYAIEAGSLSKSVHAHRSISVLKVVKKGIAFVGSVVKHIAKQVGDPKAVDQLGDGKDAVLSGIVCSGERSLEPGLYAKAAVFSKTFTLLNLPLGPIPAGPVPVVIIIELKINLQVSIETAMCKANAVTLKPTNDHFIVTPAISVSLIGRFSAGVGAAFLAVGLFLELELLSLHVPFQLIMSVQPKVDAKDYKLPLLWDPKVTSDAVANKVKYPQPASSVGFWIKPRFSTLAGSIGLFARFGTTTFTYPLFTWKGIRNIPIPGTRYLCKQIDPASDICPLSTAESALAVLNTPTHAANPDDRPESSGQCFPCDFVPSLSSRWRCPMYPQRYAALAGMPNMDDAAVAAFLTKSERGEKFSNIRLLTVCFEKVDRAAGVYTGYYGVLNYDYSTTSTHKPLFYRVVAEYKSTNTYDFAVSPAVDLDTATKWGPKPADVIAPPFLANLKSAYETVQRKYLERTAGVKPHYDNDLTARDFNSKRKQRPLSWLDDINKPELTTEMDPDRDWDAVPLKKDLDQLEPDTKVATLGSANPEKTWRTRQCHVCSRSVASRSKAETTIVCPRAGRRQAFWTPVTADHPFNTHTILRNRDNLQKLDLMSVDISGAFQIVTDIYNIVDKQTTFDVIVCNEGLEQEPGFKVDPAKDNKAAATTAQPKSKFYMLITAPLAPNWRTYLYKMSGYHYNVYDVSQKDRVTVETSATSTSVSIAATENTNELMPNAINDADEDQGFKALKVSCHSRPVPGGAAGETKRYCRVEYAPRTVNKRIRTKMFDLASDLTKVVTAKYDQDRPCLPSASLTDDQQKSPAFKFMGDLQSIDPTSASVGTLPVRSNRVCFVCSTTGVFSKSLECKLPVKTETTDSSEAQAKIRVGSLELKYDTKFLIRRLNSIAWAVWRKAVAEDTTKGLKDRATAFFVCDERIMYEKVTPPAVAPPTPPAPSTQQAKPNQGVILTSAAADSAINFECSISTSKQPADGDTKDYEALSYTWEINLYGLSMTRTFTYSELSTLKKALSAERPGAELEDTSCSVFCGSTKKFNERVVKLAQQISSNPILYTSDLFVKFLSKDKGTQDIITTRLRKNIFFGGYLCYLQGSLTDCLAYKIKVDDAINSVNAKDEEDAEVLKKIVSKPVEFSHGIHYFVSKVRAVFDYREKADISDRQCSLIDGQTAVTPITTP